MGMFDSLLTAIAPERAVKRAAAQSAIRAINSGYSNYGASLHKKSMRGWTWHGGSPKEDIEDNLRVLRERSRDAFMGVPLATGAIKTMRTNVVCGGLTPTPQIDNAFLGISDEEAQKINAQIAREFGLWANKPTCDADRLDNFYMSFRSDVESAIAVSPRDVACTVYIFFMLTGGKMPSEKDMSEMQTYLMNDARRPMTDRVICKAPEEVEYSIDFTYYIGSGNSKGASIVQESVAKAVEEFQEWQRSIGRDINPMELIARLRAAGVKRVELRQPVDKVIENGMDSGKAVVQIPKLSGTPTIIYGGIEDD